MNMFTCRIGCCKAAEIELTKVKIVQIKIFSELQKVLHKK